MGTALLAEGRADEASDGFEQALTHRPDFPEAFNNLGNAWRELGDLAAAIAAYRNATALGLIKADASANWFIIARRRAMGRHEADQEKLVDMVRQGVRVPPYLPAFEACVASESTALRPAMDQADKATREAIFEYKPLVGESTHSSGLFVREISSKRDRAADGRIVRAPRSRSL